MSWLDEMHEDLIIFRLKRVGRKNMSNYELWESWLNEDS